MPGPVPNRSNDLARPRERKGGQYKDEQISTGVLLPVEWPEPDPEWDSIALMIWESAKNSGQAYWYQQTDIAYLYFVCDEISEYRRPYIKVDDDGNEVVYKPKRNGQILATINQMLGSLVMTEGERRRARIELEKPLEENNNPELALVHNLMDSLKT